MKKVVKTGELYSTFNFDGKDSADMGIVNTTSGATYQYAMAPAFSDNVKQAACYDGQYYYGTQITKQVFAFNCFCVDLTEKEFRKLRKWLSPRNVGKLILSNQPYKYYIVKPVSISTLSGYPVVDIQDLLPRTNDDYDREHTMERWRYERPVFTGSFTITFETVGSAYGYAHASLSSLEYDDGNQYDSGLLYGEAMGEARFHYDYPEEIKIFNPGDVPFAPILTIDGYDDMITFRSNNLISIVDLEGLSGPTVIDFKRHMVINNDNYYSSRIKGDIILCNPSEDSEDLTTITIDGDIASLDIEEEIQFL